MRYTRRAFVGTAILVGAPALAIGAQPQVITQTVTGRPSCATCEIVVEKVFTVTDRGDSAAIAPVPGPVRDSRGRFYFKSYNSANGIVVYDSTGKLVGRFGRPGSGPGEFGAGSSPLIGKGDSVFVCSPAKCQLFSPDYRYVRTIQFAQMAVPFGAVVFGNGEIALKLGGDQALWSNPIHRLSPTGELIGSFGYSPPITNPRCIWCVPAMGIGLAANGEDIWVAPAGRYELQLWSGRGALKKRIVVTNSPWFPSWDPIPNDSPRSRIWQVIEGDGVLFLIASAAKVEEGKAPPLPAGTKINARGAAGPRPNVSQSPHIEAIDLASGTVLAARSIPGLVSSFGGRYILSVRDGDGSVQLYDVWRISLRR